MFIIVDFQTLVQTFELLVPFRNFSFIPFFTLFLSSLFILFTPYQSSNLLLIQSLQTLLGFCRKKVIPHCDFILLPQICILFLLISAYSNPSFFIFTRADFSSSLATCFLNFFCMIFPKIDCSIYSMIFRRSPKNFMKIFISTHSLRKLSLLLSSRYFFLSDLGK